MLTEDGTIKIFPITVPILSGHATPFFKPPAPEMYSEPHPIGPHLSARYPTSAVQRLQDRFSSTETDPTAMALDPAWIELLDEAEQLAVVPGHERLMAIAHLAEKWRSEGVISYPHQKQAAKKVLFEMGGRAILADEVGLGKTIEAGLIIKELILRGLARKILILTPQGLLWQWHQEMKNKFNLLFGVQRNVHDWERSDRLIASIDKAKRHPHRDIVAGMHYDVIVVDEAHKLKSDQTQLYRFVNAIPRTYTLLLTATPVQNDLKELYNLIHLVRPGQLGTYKSFRNRFTVDRRVPKQVDELKELLSGVMVRHRRIDGHITLPDRHVHHVPVTMTPPERLFYDRLDVRTDLELLPTSALTLLTLKREACSSPVAAAVTLDKIARRQSSNDVKAALNALVEKAMLIPPHETAKIDALFRILQSIDDRHLIVFTEYVATQKIIIHTLQCAGITAFPFDGSMSSSRKQWMRELFLRQGGVLVSTESGGEGLNFQFCRHIVNYDLPWNPMRVEQRIGRVHRLGQTKDVHIYNMATQQTVEDHILYLLHEKINMFELAIGQLDVIIHRLHGVKSLEKELTRIFTEQTDGEGIREQLDRLADTMALSRPSEAPNGDGMNHDVDGSGVDGCDVDSGDTTNGHGSTNGAKTRRSRPMNIDTLLQPTDVATGDVGPGHPVADTSAGRRLEKLCTTYFHLMGTPVQKSGETVYRVELDDAGRQELEAAPTFAYQNNGPGGLTTYYFAFGDGADGNPVHPDAEYVVPGSQRAQQIIDAIRRQSETSRFWMPASTPLAEAYRPLYVFWLRMQYRPATRPGQVRRMAVDLVDGIPMAHPAQSFLQWPLRPGMPDDGLPLEPTAVDLETAFRIAYDAITQSVEEDVLQWASLEWERATSEIERLRSYYSQKDREGHPMEEERQRRLMEAEKLLPSLVVSPAAVARIDVPVTSAPVHYLV